MTKKDFFIILIKVFGLYSIISVLFSVLPFNIAFVVQNKDLTGFLWLILTAVIIVGLFYFLLAKADKVCDFLKLKNGFDDDRIDFSGLKSIDIIKFAILIIGGTLFIKNVPLFLSHTLFAFKSSIPKEFDDALNEGLLKYNKPEDYLPWATSAFNLIVGYLLVTNFNRLSKYLNNKIQDGAPEGIGSTK